MTLPANQQLHALEIALRLYVAPGCLYYVAPELCFKDAGLSFVPIAGLQLIMRLSLAKLTSLQQPVLRSGPGPGGSRSPGPRPKLKALAAWGHLVPPPWN